MDNFIELHLKEIERLKNEFKDAQTNIEKSQLMTLINVMSLSVVNHLMEKTQQNQSLKKAS
jgi:hypothetical protein